MTTYDLVVGLVKVLLKMCFCFLAILNNLGQKNLYLNCKKIYLNASQSNKLFFFRILLDIDIMSLKRIGSKFLVISWKNLLLKRRHWFMTMVEVVPPIILFVMIAVIRWFFRLPVS